MSLLIPEFFTIDELKCTCGCDSLKPPDPARYERFLEEVARARIRVNSGNALNNTPLYVKGPWRCLNHPIEQRKYDTVFRPRHMHHHAALDLDTVPSRRFLLVEYALQAFGGVGIKYKLGTKGGFVHVDDREDRRVWTY